MEHIRFSYGLLFTRNSQMLIPAGIRVAARKPQPGSGLEPLPWHAGKASTKKRLLRHGG